MAPEVKEKKKKAAKDILLFLPTVFGAQNRAFAG
jgi:hypothetical protein